MARLIDSPEPFSLEATPSGGRRPVPDENPELPLYNSKQELAELRISANDLVRWQTLGWTELSADRDNGCSWDDTSELRFLRDISRSGLTEAQIDLLLSKLPKPYRFPVPERIAYSFTSGWLEVLPPPPTEIDDVERFIKECAEEADIDSLTFLAERISDALDTLEEDAEDSDDPEDTPELVLGMEDWTPAENHLADYMDLERACRDTQHYAGNPTQCDICHCQLSDHHLMVDGDRNDRGFEWAFMCPPCAVKTAAGIAWGQGQLYCRQNDGRWRQIGGFPPEEDV